MNYGEHPKLTRLPAAAQYLKSLYIGIPIEQFYLLCLDSSGRLIECLLLQKGTIDETPFYLGHLLQALVTAGADAIVLCHNHPGGTPRPSQADVRCTLDALRALHALGVVMLDHVIIAGTQTVSLRENGFIPAVIWDQQDSESRLLCHWLDDFVRRIFLEPVHSAQEALDEALRRLGGEAKIIAMPYGGSTLPRAPGDG